MLAACAQIIAGGGDFPHVMTCSGFILYGKNSILISLIAAFP
jgi:hypothetical protein